MKPAVSLRFVFLLLSSMALISCFDSGNEAEVEDPDESTYKAEKGSRDAIKAKVVELKAEKKALETSLKEIKAATAKQGDLAKSELEINTELEAVRGYAIQLDSLATEIDTSLTSWRDATRASFKGVQLPEITTIDGKKYTAITINQVTDDSIIIEHSGGMQTIPVMELPVGLRKNVIHEATVLAEKGL